MSSKVKLHMHQRIQDAYGNKERILNPQIRDGMVRVRMDYGFNRDYDITTIKPIKTDG